MSVPSAIPLPQSWLDRPIRVALVGAGGTGSQVADQLASLNATLAALGHPGFEVTIFDPDAVSEANVGRQRFCRADIGRNKAFVLTHRINMFHGLAWEAAGEAYDPAEVHPNRNTLVIGCVDSVSARKGIADSGGAWWLDCGNNDKSGHVILGQCQFPAFMGCGEFRLPTWLDLFPDTPEDDDGPSCSVRQAIQRQSWPVNHRAAGLATELLYQWIREGQISWHGTLFTVTPPSVTPLPIKAETWAPFGYVPEAA